MALRLARNTRQHFNRFVAVCQVRYGHGDPGSGAGMGGGSGGSIRDAGGAFGKMEQAHEDQYFRSLQEHQFKELKEHHDDEIEYHTEAISRHREKITRLEKRMENIDNQHKEG